MALIVGYILQLENSGWQNPLSEQQRHKGHGPSHKHRLREPTRSQGYHDPLERFTPLPVGGANAANQLNNLRQRS